MGISKLGGGFWHNYFLFVPKRLIMLRKLFAGVSILVAASCNNNTAPVDSTGDTSRVPSDTVISPGTNVTRDTTIGGCYTQIFKRDTVTMQIDITGNNATGPLTYKLYEKDMNDGSVKAVLSDSVIMGWYLFRSEGVMSVRQVAWRVKPGQLLPATGDVMQRNDSTVFSNPDKLRFDDKNPFVKVRCSL